MATDCSRAAGTDDNRAWAPAAYARGVGDLLEVTSRELSGGPMRRNVGV